MVDQLPLWSAWFQSSTLEPKCALCPSWSDRPGSMPGDEVSAPPRTFYCLLQLLKPLFWPRSCKPYHMWHQRISSRSSPIAMISSLSALRNCWNVHHNSPPSHVSLHALLGYQPILCLKSLKSDPLIQLSGVILDFQSLMFWMILQVLCLGLPTHFAGWRLQFDFLWEMNWPFLQQSLSATCSLKQ